MKTSIEITNSIIKTLKKADCRLSEEQEAILFGSMAVWIDHIKKDQDKITRHACTENVVKLDGLSTGITKGSCGDLFQSQSHPTTSGPSFKDKVLKEIMNTRAL